MAQSSSDDEEQQPLVDDDNGVLQEEDKEEEKEEYLKQSYQNDDGLPFDGEVFDDGFDDEVFDEEHDISHSSLLLCRITIFLYAFVSILIDAYFPEENDGHIHATMTGWFKFCIVINIIACIIGMTGVYINHSKSIKICWISLIFALGLTGLLVIIYVFDTDDGATYEANQRCYVFMNDTQFQQVYTMDTCQPKMKTQILWTTIGLYVIYLIACSFGIHIIKNAEELVFTHEKYLDQQRYYQQYDDDDDDGNDDIDYDLDEDNLSDLDDQQDIEIPNYGSNDIMMDNRKNK